MAAVLEEILQLLNNIASDLDQMLNDLCRTFPIASPPLTSASTCRTPRSCSRQLEIQTPNGIRWPGGDLDQSLTPSTAGVPPETRHTQTGDGDDGNSSTGDTGDRSGSGTSSDAEFFSLDEDQSSDAAVAGSDSEDSRSPTPPGRPGGPGGQRGAGDPGDPGGPGGGARLRHIPLLERLIHTHSIWYLPNISRAGAMHLLHNRDEGTFLVRQAGRRDTMFLSVRVGAKPHLEHYTIESTPKGLRLNSTPHYYQAVPVLVAHCCDKRDDIPVPLLLPYAITAAKTHQDLASLSLLGQDFWTSPLSHRKPEVKRTVFHTTVAAYNNSSAQRLPSQCRRSASDKGLRHRTRVKVQTPTIDMKTPTGQSATLPKVVHRSQRTPPECNGAPRSGSEGTLYNGELPRNLSTSSLTNHCRDRSAFQTPPIRSDVGQAQDANGLPNGLDEDSQELSGPGTPFFRPIQNGVTHLPDVALVGKTGSKTVQSAPRTDLNAHNPGYASDCTSDGDFIDPGFMVDIGDKAKVKATTERVAGQTTIRTAEKIVLTAQKKFEPVVFTFDLKVPKTDDNVNRSPRSVISKVTHQIGQPTTPTPTLSNCSQYSSPAYVEPYDSLVGKVHGVTETRGAVRVNNVLRPRGKPPQQQTTFDSGETTAVAAGFGLRELQPPPPPRRATSHREARPARDRSLPRSFHTMPTAGGPLLDKPPPSPVKAAAAGAGPAGYPPPPHSSWRRSRDSSLDITLTLAQPPPGSRASRAIADSPKSGSPGTPFGRSLSLRSLTPTGELLGAAPPIRPRDPARAKSLPKEVPDLGRGRYPQQPHPALTLPPSRTRTPPAFAFAGTPRAAVSSPIIPKELEDDLRAVLESLEEAPTPQPSQFPLFHRSTHSLSSGHTSFSDTTTVEDLISNESPELTLKPIKPLTIRNLQRMSDYDNLTSRGSGSRRTVASSAGTHYCQPWDSAWLDFLNTGTPPPATATVTATTINMADQRQHPHVAPPPPTPPIAKSSPDIFRGVSSSRPCSGSGSDFRAPQGQVHGHHHSAATRGSLGDGSVSEADYSSVYCGSESGRPLSELLGSEPAASSFEYHTPVGTIVPSSGAVLTSSPPDRPPHQNNHHHHQQQQQQQQQQHYQRDSYRLSQQSHVSYLEDPYDDEVINGIPISDDEGVEDDLGKDRLTSVLGSPKLLSMRHRGHAPATKVRDFVSSLAQQKDTTFGITVENFIRCTIEGSENNPHIVVRNVRQFMNGIKNYLVQHGETKLTSLIEEERAKLGSTEFLNIDSLIEGALHKCVIKPLKQHIYQLFVQDYKANGSLQQLSESIKYARTKSAYELGIRSGILPPQGPSLELVKHYLTRMQKAYSPLKKLENLLCATSSIYNSVRAPGENDTDFGRNNSLGMGADDFLPLFIYVLAQCGMIGAEIEADYMWGLLHPCLLAGEGAYHLTTLSSAVQVLKGLRGAMETSTECPRLPSLGDLQGFMKVIIPDEKRDSIITKTLPVRPNMTTKDICNLIAHRFKITNAQDYGLFILVNGVEQRLGDTTCPLVTRGELTEDNQDCVFAYKRVNAKFAWPIKFQK